MHFERLDKTSPLGRGRMALLMGCTTLVALQPLFANAQDSGAGEGTVLERITVQGAQGGTDNDSRSIVATTTTGASKIPTAILDTAASVSVITAKEMQQRNASTVEEVLRYTAGVSTDFYGSDDRFDYFKIRGFDAYVYRDGLLIGDPFGGIREEAYAYERAEVLKGASSTTFGVSDPGGSVNFVTKTPKSERFGEAFVSGGSYNRAETGVDFGDNITEDDTLSYRLTAKARKADGEYDYSRDDEKFFMGGLTWRPTDMTSLTVVYDHLNKDGVPGSGGHPLGTNFDRSRFFGEPDYNYRGTNRNSVSVMLDHDFGSGLTLGANARYSKTNSDFGYAYISSTPTNGSTRASRSYFGNDQSVENHAFDTHLQYDTSFDTVDSKSLVGFTYYRTSGDNKSYFGAAPSIDWLRPVYTGRPATVPLYQSLKTEQDTRAVYIQQDLTFFDKLIVSGSLRNDWLDTKQTNMLSGVRSQGDASELTSRLGLTYRWTEEFATYASYSESAVPSSINVEPERGQQYEVGVKYQPLEFPALFSAAVYDLTKTNITRTDPVTNLQSAIGEVRVQGVDLEAKAEINENWSLTAAYSYLSSEIVENGTQGNEGNQLAFVPHHIASLWATYSLPGDGRRGDMTVSLGARYSSSYYFDDANTLSTDAHVVFDAAATYKLAQNTSIEFNVANLFDEKHLDYGGFGANFYNPGRSFSLTLRQTW